MEGEGTILNCFGWKKKRDLPGGWGVKRIRVAKRMRNKGFLSVGRVKGFKGLRKDEFLLGGWKGRMGIKFMGGTKDDLRVVKKGEGGRSTRGR